MKKHKNYYYGVCVDGLLLKIAEIEHSRDKLILHRLEDFKLAKPLFTENQSLQTSSNAADGIRDISFDSSSDDFDPNDSDLFSDSLNLDSLDEKSEPRQVLKTPEEESKERNRIERQSDSVQKFLGKFFLDEGKLSISAIDNRLDWKFIKTNKKCSLSEVRKLALSAAQQKDINCSVDFVPITNTTCNAVIHQGNFDIMTFLNNTAKNLYSKKKHLVYKYIEPLNISILNIFNLFYNKNTDQYTTLLYLGEETKIGFIIKDKKIVKDFPIMVFDTEPERIREAVFAKLMLEKESAEYPVMDNIVLAGDLVTDDDVNFYNKRTGKEHSLFTIDSEALKKIHYSLVVGKAVDIELIPSFIIPISLAIKGILFGHNDLVNINLLPKRVTESYQVFKLGGLGYLLLLLIFLTTIIGTDQIVSKKKKLTDLKRQHKLAEEELTILKNFFALIQSHQQKIDQIQTANSRSAGVAAEKNSWSHILFMIADFTNKNPLLWVDNVSTTETRFTLKGSSYYRDRITYLSTLFDDGNITKISERHIGDHLVWDYEMNFLRPKGADIPVNIPLNEYETYESYIKHLEQIAEQRKQEALLKQVHATSQQDPIQSPLRSTSTQISTQEEAKNLYEEAKNYYLNSNFNETISLLDQYIRRYPSGDDISLAYYLLGELYYVLGNYEKAVPNFNNVYRIRKDKVVESIFFLARSHEKLSDYGNAIRFYNILINEYPNNPLSRTANEQVLLLREAR